MKKGTTAVENNATGVTPAKVTKTTNKKTTKTKKATKTTDTAAATQLSAVTELAETVTAQAFDVLSVETRARVEDAIFAILQKIMMLRILLNFKEITIKTPADLARWFALSSAKNGDDDKPRILGAIRLTRKAWFTKKESLIPANPIYIPGALEDLRQVKPIVVVVVEEIFEEIEKNKKLLKKYVTSVGDLTFLERSGKMLKVEEKLPFQADSRLMNHNPYWADVADGLLNFLGNGAKEKLENLSVLVSARIKTLENRAAYQVEQQNIEKIKKASAEIDQKLLKSRERTKVDSGDMNSFYLIVSREGLFSGASSKLAGKNTSVQKLNEEFILSGNEPISILDTLSKEEIALLPKEVRNILRPIMLQQAA